MGFSYLGGGFKYFLCSPLLGEDSHFDYFFSTGLKPPTSYKLGNYLHKNRDYRAAEKEKKPSCRGIHGDMDFFRTSVFKMYFLF